MILTTVSFKSIILKVNHIAKGVETIRLIVNQVRILTRFVELVARFRRGGLAARERKLELNRL